MINIQDLICYYRDHHKYGNYRAELFWFQKNKGKKWLRGQNFGDYLSLVIVGELLVRNGSRLNDKKSNAGTILAVGSILHFAKTNDIIWGAGINGKVEATKHLFTSLDVRAVRGPLTKKFLVEMGIEVGDIFGDPVLLLPSLFPELKVSPKKGKIILIPNLNELEQCSTMCPQGIKLVSPMGYWKDVVNEILSSELVLTSSLHGLLISEVFGVPARFVRPFGGETLFKYEDYYLGTGRVLKSPAESFKDGIDIEMGTKSSSPIFDPEELIKQFPYDLFN